MIAAGLLGSALSFDSLGGAALSAWSQAAKRAFSGQPLEPAAGWAAWQLFARWLVVPGACALTALVLQRAVVFRLGRVAAAQSGPAAVPLLFGYVRLALLAVGLCASLQGSLPGVLAAWQLDATELLRVIARVMQMLSLRAALLLLALGLGDLTVQQILRLRRLRMTRREWQDEQREQAGDPRLSAERRTRTRASPALQLSAATLVLTGPGLAVALRYVPGEQTAPVLWQRASGSAAVELVGRAYAQRAPLATDDTLALELFRLEVLSAIPASLHARVAAHWARAQNQVA